MKRNVLSWLTTEVEAASHAIILTHNIDFLFVQSILLPRLRAAGSPRLTIFADATCALETYRSQHHLLEGLGSTYRVVPVDLGAFRRFHPKAYLLASRDRAVAAIGSGNLTFGGMSANHEVWACGVSDGEGAGLISGLRRYIPQIVARTDLPESVAENVAAAFNEELPWVAGLPEAHGIAFSPADRPLLDQIADHVTGEILRVSVITPFFDDNGAALSELARRFSAPVTAYIQPGRAGLWKAAASRLPSTVTIGTASGNAGEKDRSIHAKIFVFHRTADDILVVGSANCSRAALTLGPDACNAEMAIVQTTAHEETKELLGGIALSEDVPDLPEEPPSEDWDTYQPTFRILAARHAVDVMEVAYQSPIALSNIAVETDEGLWPATEMLDGKNVARFAMIPRMRQIVLTGTNEAGLTLRSEACWVDDEISLNAPATLRRVLRHLQDAQSPNRGRVDVYISVLDHFRDYLRDPESARGWGRATREVSTAPLPYDPAAVFADGFSESFRIATPHVAMAGGPADPLAIIAALFSVQDESSADRKVVSDPVDDEPETGLPEVAASGLPPRVTNPGRLRKAVDGMVAALSDPTFVQGRRPELLGAELALAAIVLVTGLSKGDLDKTMYRSATRTLWQNLFFGAQRDGDGLIVKRLQSLDVKVRGAFELSFASPRLSAALILWSLPEWRADDNDSLWFRLSAAQLHYRHPWLFASAPSDKIRDQLAEMALHFLAPDERQAPFDAWLDLVRSGDALSCLCKTLENVPSLELRKFAKAEFVDVHDVLWQAKSLAVPIKACRRDARTTAEVRVIGQAMIRKFKGDHLLPLADLLAAGDLEVPEGARKEIERLMDAAVSVVSAGT